MTAAYLYIKSLRREPRRNLTRNMPKFFCPKIRWQNMSNCPPNVLMDGHVSSQAPVVLLLRVADSVDREKKTRMDEIAHFFLLLLMGGLGHGWWAGVGEIPAVSTGRCRKYFGNANVTTGNHRLNLPDLPVMSDDAG